MNQPTCSSKADPFTLPAADESDVAEAAPCDAAPAPADEPLGLAPPTGVGDFAEGNDSDSSC